MDSNEKFPVAWMLSIILLVFVCMLIISEDRRITSVTEYNYLAENVALMKQRMDAINNRFNDMLKKVEDERIRMEYPPPYREFPTNAEIKKHLIRVPLNTEKGYWKDEKE